MRSPLEFETGPDDIGRRLDRLLKVLLPSTGLSALYAALRQGDIRVNGLKAKPDTRMAAGDRIEIAARLKPPALPSGDDPRVRDEAGEDPCAPYLIRESRELVFLVKPRGIESHGAEGLDRLVLQRLKGGRPASLSFNPGPLHRLDRNTSGIISFPASAEGARVFSQALRDGRLRKFYLALLTGRLEEAGRWEDLLLRDEGSLTTRRARPGEEGSRTARAKAWPLCQGNMGGQALSLALIELETGITHQIRAQAALRALPLLGDRKYGGAPIPPAFCPPWFSAPGAPKGGGYLLHAWVLACEPPLFADLPPRIEAELPADSRALLEAACGKEALEEALAGALCFLPR